jgi:hypothetical protein
MHSSRFLSKQILISFVIALTPLVVSANLQVPHQQYETGYAQDDNEDALGALPSLEAPDFPDFVEQTYPIDEHYGEAKKS